MTLYERLEEKAKEMGFTSITKFFDAAEVNTNARVALKKTCYICGKEYIVSIKNTADPYICPTCDAQWKREQRKALEKKKNAH